MQALELTSLNANKIPRGSSSSGRRSTVVVSAVAITAIAVTSASASASWTPGMLDDDAVAVEVSPVEFVDRVFGVSGIFKFDKTVTLLDHDIANATVTWTGQRNQIIEQMDRRRFILQNHRSMYNASV